MLINRIRACNFRSFDDLDVGLGKFNVLIGANASGKSNFVSILQLFRDAVEHGLDDAISMQGGADYVRNVNIGPLKNLSVELCIGNSMYRGRRIQVRLEEAGRFIGLSVHEFTYRFSVEFQRKGYRVAEETLVTNCGFVGSESSGGDEEEIGRGRIVLTRDGEDIKYELDPSDIPISTEEIIAPFFTDVMRERLSPKELLVEIPGFWALFLPPLSFVMSDFFSGISIYHFDPRLPKRATAITGKAELEPDAGNLAIVVKNILQDRRKRQEIYNLMKDLLPLVEDIRVRTLPDKSLLATLRETYSGKKFLPAFLLSDGTINITALIVALYFEEKPLVVIEEPESNIHPYLISKVIDMMKDVSERRNKQIIITTHNPEVVRYAGIENLLLVHRDDQGFSKVSRPAEKEEVKTFLEHDMGIQELYVQNLLEW